MKVEQSIAEEERLLYEQSDLRIEVVELTRLAAIKVRLLVYLFVIKYVFILNELNLLIIHAFLF